MKKGYTLIELLTVIAIIGVLAAIISGPIIRCFGFTGYNYSEGQRTGVVYKLSKKGFIWKTYEGEMSLNLTTKDSDGNLVNKIFYFSVSDPKVAEEIDSLSEKKIQLNYIQYKFRGYCYGSSEYDVVSVNSKTPEKE